MRITVGIQLCHNFGGADAMIVNIPDKQLVNMSDKDLVDAFREMAFDPSKVEFDWDKSAVDKERKRLRDEGIGKQ